MALSVVAIIVPSSKVSELSCPGELNVGELKAAFEIGTISDWSIAVTTVAAMRKPARTVPSDLSYPPNVMNLTDSRDGRLLISTMISQNRVSSVSSVQLL